MNLTCRSILMASLIVFLGCAAGPARADLPPSAVKDSCEIFILPDHADGTYKAGEKITFTIRLVRGGQPVEKADVQYTIEVNGNRKEAPRVAAVEKGQARVQAELAEPGCVMVVATYALSEKDAVRVEAGTAVEPEKLRPALAAPDDFDAFWAEEKRKLSEVPMNARLTAVENVPEAVRGNNVEVFDVQVDCVQVDCPGGAPVSAYFARPKGAKPKSCPAHLTFHGAGVSGANLTGAAGQAMRGRLGMDVNAHGIPNGKPEQYYKDLLAGELKEYWHRGNDDRQRCYFRGMYLRLVRAIDFVTSQPEWDGRTVIVSGSSQGGAQAVVAAGLDPRVTILSASLPALCDLGAQTAGRPAAWPIGARRLDEKQVQTLRYFDVCHFAARTQAAAVVRVGLVDRTCWPYGVLAMTNQLRGSRRVVLSPVSGHGWSPPDAYKEASRAFEELLASPAGKAP